MEMEQTLTIMVFGGLLVAFGNIRSRREYRPGNLPLIPDAALQFVGLLIIILMAAHIITLVTGTPFVGRSGF